MFVYNPERKYFDDVIIYQYVFCKEHQYVGHFFIFIYLSGLNNPDLVCVTDRQNFKSGFRSGVIKEGFN